MKYIKKFEMYINKYTGLYLELEQLRDGNLQIILTQEGKEDIDEYEDFNIYSFSDLFDDIRSNSELYYIESLSDYNLGMSEAPAITYGYYTNDDGEFTDDGNEEDSEIFYYPDYMTKDFTKELYKNGVVIFVTAGKHTPEELQDIRIRKNARKYNL